MKRTVENAELIISKVTKMREAQIGYFAASRRKDWEEKDYWFQKARPLEKEVDRLTKEWNEDTNTLF